MPASSAGPSRLSGYTFALLAALFWGTSGACVQFLFQHRGITPEWLVTVRLFFAGTILLCIPLFKKEYKALLAPFQDKKDLIGLVLFGFSMLAVQLTYFIAIKNSNAATATVLTYLAPIVIAGYYSVIEKRLPSSYELFAITIALFGTFLIVTHGSLEGLSITKNALFWGLASAVSMAIYSIAPIQLMKRHEATIVSGWAMIIGGIIFSFVHSPLDIPGEWDTKSYLLTATIFILGTTAAFYLYMISVKVIGATKASLMACAEPLAAVLLAVIMLGVHFGFYDWLGTLCILATIAILAKMETKESL